METKMPEYFNPKLTDEVLSSFKEEFTKKRYISVKSLLNEFFASELEQFVLKDTPDSWWLTSSKYAYPQETEPSYFWCTIENKVDIIEEWKKAHEAFKRGYFSYQFDRLDIQHVEGCGCLQCALFKTFLQRSGPMHQFLEKITGLELGDPGEIFFSRYKSNQFLAQHHDKDKGIVVFNINLTREWHPSWGGMLHIWDPEKKEITEIFPPIFNRMVLYDLSEGHRGIEHWVNHVAPKIEQNRYALTGWWKK